MSKPVLPLLGIAILSLLLAGCDQTKTAAELNAEKQKADRATRKQQAVKFYQDLVEKFPDSPYAAQARERIQAIGPVGTPVPKPGAAGSRK